MTSIKIGYSLSLTGAFGAYGQSAYIAQKIWEHNINKKGGLLGRRVELVCIDDESNTMKIPGIYKKLIVEEKVDLVMGGYGVSSVSAAGIIVDAHEKFFISLMGKSSGKENHLSMIPVGAKPNVVLTDSFFKNLAKNSSVAIISADAEFTKNTIAGARENVVKNGHRIIFEHSYALNTFDFETLAVELHELNPDAIYVSAYSSDAFGIMKAINNLHLHPKKIGVSVIGPVGLKINCAGASELMEEYLSKTTSIDADILGYFLAPNAYAQLQVLEQAIVGTNSLLDHKLSGFTHEALFNTVIGEVKFDKFGECTYPQMLQVQYQNIVKHDIEETVI